MTTELVTAHAGKNHVGSEDVGALYAGALGSGRFAFDVGEGLAVTMTDANTVRIGTGVFLMDGRQVRVKEAESVKVANGSQGAFRKDLVVYTYRRDPSNGNVEEGAWSVLQGTAASKEVEAKAPGYTAGNILDGDLTATVAVAEVSLSGLTPAARLLLPSVASLRKLGDSVSRARNALILSEDVHVSGYAGVISVRHDGFGTVAERYDENGFVVDEETFVQVSGILWTDDDVGAAWPMLVKAPWQPDDLQDYWCIKIPVEVAKKGAGSVSHRTHFDRDCALYISAAASGQITYSDITTKRLFTSTDGYIYIAVHKIKPDATPAIIYVDTTVPLSSL